MRSSGEGVRTSLKRFTGALVLVRRTLRHKRSGDYELVAATGEGSRDCESGFIIWTSFQSF